MKHRLNLIELLLDKLTDPEWPQVPSRDPIAQGIEPSYIWNVWKTVQPRSIIENHEYW